MNSQLSRIAIAFTQPGTRSVLRTVLEYGFEEEVRDTLVGRLVHVQSPGAQQYSAPLQGVRVGSADAPSYLFVIAANEVFPRGATLHLHSCSDGVLRGGYTAGSITGPADASQVLPNRYA